MTKDITRKEKRKKRNNKIKGMLPVQGIGRDGQSRYTFRLENGMSMDKIYEEAEISLSLIHI